MKRKIKKNKSETVTVREKDGKAEITIHPQTRRETDYQRHIAGKNRRKNKQHIRVSNENKQINNRERNER